MEPPVPERSGARISDGHFALSFLGRRTGWHCGTWRRPMSANKGPIRLVPFSPMTYQLVLREIERDDLEVFFRNEQDPVANEMAAFTAEDPADRAAFLDRWDRIFADGNIVGRTILVDGEVVGSILVHNWFGDPEVTYWISQEHWGRGVTTEALARFLDLVEVRPLYARVAFDNHASRRVLEKCGFVVTGSERGHANARGEEIEELVLTLS